MARNAQFSTPRCRSQTRLIIELVRFRNGDAGRVVHAADNGGVIAGTERHEDGRFVVVSRREASVLDFVRVRGAPVGF